MTRTQKFNGREFWKASSVRTGGKAYFYGLFIQTVDFHYLGKVRIYWSREKLQWCSETEIQSIERIERPFVTTTTVHGYASTPAKAARLIQFDPSLLYEVETTYPTN